MPIGRWAPRAVPWLAVAIAATAFHWTAITTSATVQSTPTSGDVINTFRPTGIYQFHYLDQHGSLPRWWDRAGLGTPSALGGGLYATEYPVRQLALSVAGTAGGASDLLVWAQTVIAALAAMALARCYGLGRWPSAFAGTAYALGHVTVRWGPFYWSPAFIAALPIAVLGTEMIWRRRPLPGMGLLALGIGISGLGSVLQVTHMLVQAVGLVVLLRFLSDPEPVKARLRPLLHSAAGLVLGLIASIVVWLPFLHEQGRTIRQSIPSDEVTGIKGAGLHSLFDPTLLPARDMLSNDSYLSLLVPVLALIGVIVSMRSRRLFVLPVVLLFFLLAGLKTPLYSVLVALVPGWNVQTDVARVAFVDVLFIALLAGVGADWLFRWKRWYALTAICAVFLISVGFWALRVGSGFEGSKGLGFLVVLLLGAGAALALFYSIVAARSSRLAKYRIGPIGGATAAVAGVAILLVTLAGAFTERNLLLWSPSGDIAPSEYRPWLHQIAEHDDPEGRWMSYCQTFPTYFFGPSVFLEVPGRWLDRYDSFTEKQWYAYWQELTGSTRFEDTTGPIWADDQPTDPPPQPALVNAAGIDRIVSNGTCAADTRTFGWKTIDSRDGVTVYRNPDAYPMAFVSHRWRSIDGPVEDVPPRLVAEDEPFSAHSDLVSAGIGSSAGGAPVPAAVERDGSERVDVALRSPVDRPSLLVLLDAYHPDWHAYSGDRELDVVPVNGMFRGVVVRPGDTAISFRYEPWARGLLVWLTRAAWLAIALLLCAALLHSRLPLWRVLGPTP
jgi:hypothetical protein